MTRWQGDAAGLSCNFVRSVNFRRTHGLAVHLARGAGHRVEPRIGEGADAPDLLAICASSYPKLWIKPSRKMADYLAIDQRQIGLTTRCSFTHLEIDAYGFISRSFDMLSHR